MTERDPMGQMTEEEIMETWEIDSGGPCIESGCAGDMPCRHELIAFARALLRREGERVDDAVERDICMDVGVATLERVSATIRRMFGVTE